MKYSLAFLFVAATAISVASATGGPSSVTEEWKEKAQEFIDFYIEFNPRALIIGLAKEGFLVDGTTYSPEALRKIAEEAKEKNLLKLMTVFMRAASEFHKLFKTEWKEKAQELIDFYFKFNPIALGNGLGEEGFLVDGKTYTPEAFRKIAEEAKEKNLLKLMAVFMHAALLKNQ